MKKMTAIIFLIMFGNLLFGQTKDAFKKIPVSDVPQEVLNQFEIVSKVAALSWGASPNFYSAKVMVKNKTTYHRFDNGGNYIEKRVVLDWEKDAMDVLKTSKEKSYYKYWKVIEFYKVTSYENDIYYIAQLSNDDNDLKTIYFDEQGTLEEKSNAGH